MVDYESFEARLDYALQVHGMTNAEFAQGVHPETGQQTVTNWRRRKRIGSPSHQVVRSLLPGVSVEWINDGVGDLPRPDIGRGALRMDASGLDADSIDVPGFAHSLALGDGSTPEDYAETHSLKFRTSSLRRQGLLGRRLEVYYGAGDSMEPTITDGAAILVDRDDCEPQDGAIFVLEGDNNGAMAKRLTMIDGRWFFESDNKSDPKWRKPVPLNGAVDYRICGKVRWIARWEG